MKHEIQKLTDTIDLMRDEFMRIKACGDEKWEKAAIDGLCDRAIKRIEQNVPVIVQRDQAETKVFDLRRALLKIKDTRKRTGLVNGALLHDECVDIATQAISHPAP